MNKKVMALAVAGALIAPVSALAQTTIYGVFNVEYGFYDAPNDSANQSRNSSDAFNSGASRIGFRGEEKLGGGMSAWYQCESDIRFLAGGAVTTVRGANSGELCDRNSAVGLRGGFGNFFAGTWDSPLKTASGVSRITNETGWLGTQGLLLTDFSNRNAQTLNYSTPNLGGFTVNAQVSTTNAAMDTLSTNTAAKGRITAIGGQFATGPLAVVAGYEKRDDNRSDAGTANAKDTAWAAGATYVFGPFKAGLTLTNIEFDDGAGSVVERAAWGLAGTYRTGPHLITLGYTLADDVDFNGASQSDTGANQIVIAYNYLLSKRTNVGVGYSQVDNDDFGAYNLTGRTNDVEQGAKGKVFSFNLTHTF
jgi:predicted porin